MKKSDELRAQKAGKIDAQRVMLEARKASETKVFTTEQRTSFNALTTEIEALDEEIRNAVIDEAAEARAAAAAGTPVGASEQREKENMVARYSLHKALRSQLQGAEPLDGVEAEYNQEMRKEARDAGVAIKGVAVPNGSRLENRADGQTVTQDSGAYGANLVATNQMGVIDQLRPKPILERMGATYMRGLTGNVEFPTNDGGIVATWEGEITTVSPSKNAYGKKTMSPNRLSATTVISLQNLIQSTPSLEAMTASDIRIAMQLAIDTAGINGSGSGNVPLGILNAAGTNAVVGGTNGAAPTWAHIVAMETGIFSANAEAENMGYLINPATKGKLKTTKHEAGDLGYLMSMANEINGYQVGVSNLVPGNLTKGTLSGTANAAIFGNFKELLIGEWGFYEMVVDEITQKKSGNIELTVNQFIDMLLKQPKAFSVVKDWDIS